MMSLRHDEPDESWHRAEIHCAQNVVSHSAETDPEIAEHRPYVQSYGEITLWYDSYCCIWIVSQSDLTVIPVVGKKDTRSGILAEHATLETFACAPHRPDPTTFYYFAIAIAATAKNHLCFARCISSSLWWPTTWGNHNFIDWSHRFHPPYFLIERCQTTCAEAKSCPYRSFQRQHVSHRSQPGSYRCSLSHF